MIPSDRLSTMRNGYYANCDMILGVYDASDDTTKTSLFFEINDIKKTLPDISVIICACKTDKIYNTHKDTDYYVSAKSSEGIKKLEEAIKNIL